jgi:hypothetical protein
MRKGLLSLAVAASVASGLVLVATPASATYGTGSTYQIEISANLPGRTGGGAWLWIQLTPSLPGATSGTGDYTGSDCGRGGAVADSGDVKWSASNGMITITGVVFNGFGGLPVTVTVPSSYGHETTDIISVFPTLGPVLGLPAGAGFSQVQIAP